MTGPRAEISAGCPGAARAVGAPNAKPIYSAPPSCCCSSVSSCFGSSLPAFVLQRHAPCPPSPPSSSASLLSFALSLWLLLLLTRRSPTFCSSPAPPPPTSSNGTRKTFLRRREASRRWCESGTCGRRRPCDRPAARNGTRRFLPSPLSSRPLKWDSVFAEKRRMGR